MILVVGLSPAWQRTLEYERFVVGRVNRAIRVSEVASGKGVNVVRVAQQLGAKVRLLTVAGGHRGRLFEKSLREQGMDARILRVAAETRICQTLIANGFATTELVEESGALTKNELRDVLASFDEEIRRAKMVVLSGTVPRGCGEDFYERLARKANRCGLPVLVDAQRTQLMNAVRQKPFLVKINRDELAAATGLRCNRMTCLCDAVRSLAKPGVRWIVVTHGSEKVHIFQNASTGSVGAVWNRDRSASLLAGSRLKSAPTTTWCRGSVVLFGALEPPRVVAHNPIGSGDAMLAGIACGLGQGRTVLEAVRLGIACGSANALTAEPGFIRQSDVNRLLKRM